MEPSTTEAGAANLTPMMREIRNAKRGTKPGNKRPANAAVLRDVIRGITGDTMLDLRDRVLLTMGMMGAFRRFQLVRIRIEGVASHLRGLLVTIPSSKGAQDAKGSRSRSFKVGELYLLPVGGFAVGLLYHLTGRSVDGDSNLIVEQVHEHGGGVPRRMAPLILFVTVVRHLFEG